MIVDERMVTFINSLDEGHTEFLEQLEKEYFYTLFLKKEIFHLSEGLILRTEYE